MKIPLSTAIIDGLVIVIGKRKYVLPMPNVRHIFKSSAEKFSTIKNKGEMIDVRGKLYPLIRLYKIFDEKPLSEEIEDALMVLVESDNKQKVFMVDSIVDKREIVVKSLGERLKDFEGGVSSGTVLDDGLVGLIMDVNSIFQQQELGIAK